MAGGKVEDVYRLSPIQQGILFHALGAPESGTYFEQFSLRYEDGFEPERFIDAWQTVVDRHPVLRTAFLWENLDEPVQGVHREVVVPVDRQDWRQLEANEQEERLAAFVAADRRRGFRLTRPPLLRLAVLRLTDATYQVVWSYHHLVLDGWSAGLIMHQVSVAYQALRTGNPAPAVAAQRPYRDYLAWLRAQPLEEAEVFWRRSLDGVRGATPLGIDRGGAAGSGAADRDADTEAGWALDLVRLSEAETDALKTFAKQHRLTLNSVFQGVWAILLARYSGRTDVIFGITVSGRPPSLSGSEQMIGCFINTLPLRIAVPGEAELVPWLAEVQKQQIALRRFEHTPLAEISRWIDLPPRQELFSSILVFESFSMEASFEMTHSGVFQRTNYPLTVVVSPDREMAIRLGYDRHRFAPADIARLQGHIRSLLGAMTADPKRVLGSLPMLTSAEHEQIVTTWNATATALGDNPIVTRVAERAAEAPDKTALSDLHGTLSYRALLRRVGSLAHDLQARGIGPEVRVGLFFDRSNDMVVALLAVMAAGGAYVPLDPEHPPRRLAHVLRDARVALVLGTPATAARIEALVAELDPAPPVVLLENVDPERAEQTDAQTNGPLDGSLKGPEGLPADRARPDNLAYLIYTSGSTGLPKGVGVPRRALGNFLDAMRGQPGLGPQDVLVAVTTLSFDIAVLELLLPLVVGAQVVIAEVDQARDPVALGALLRASGASVMQATPATWQLLIAQAEEDAREATDAAAADRTFLSGLRVLAGGEPLPPPLATALSSRAREVWNLYGPTETTVWSSRARIDGSIPVTIGRPIENTTIYLVDAENQPVPVGIDGEIRIGGTGVARGYIGQPARTAERFVPDPFGSLPGARLYRTGDLGRWRGDGSLLCLGRIDHQLKIRGFRIEPGEIEHALLDVEALREAVVMAIPAAGGEPHLTAFVVAEDGAAVPAADLLRAHLGASLPSYMIPGSFLALDALPLNPNGKVDRRALADRAAAGQHDRPTLERAHVAPRSDLEGALAALFEDVLERRPVGIDDSFFDLGGHSLLAVRLIGRMRKHLGQPVPLRTLLENHTVARLAKAIEARAPLLERDIVVRLSPATAVPGAADRRLFVAVHPIGGDVRCYAALAERLGPEQPFLALQSPTKPARFDDLHTMAAGYVEALRAEQPQGPYCLGGWSMGGVVAFEMALQLHQTGETVDPLWLIDARLPDRLGLGTALSEAERVARFARDLVGLAGAATEALVEAIERHTGDDALGIALAHAKALGLVPADIERLDIQALYDRFEANLDAFRSYRPQRFAGAITLVRATAQLATDPDDDPDLGWGRWAAGGVETILTGPDHFSLLRPPAVDRLAALLSERLAGQRSHHATV